MSRNGMTHGKNAGKMIAATAALACIVCLLSACRIGEVPFIPVPATHTDRQQATQTDTNAPMTPVEWSVSRDVCTHDYLPYASADATCSADGYEMERCTLCGTIAVKTIAAAGHVWQKTKNADGSAQYQCAREGCAVSFAATDTAAERDVTYALPHDGSDAVLLYVDDYSGTVGSVTDQTSAENDLLILPRGNAVWGYQQLEAGARCFYADALRALLDFAETDGECPQAAGDVVCMTLDYTAYGLDELQARTALSYLSDDSPMLFWLDDTVRVANGSASMFVLDAYRDPTERAAAAVQLECAVQTICGDAALAAARMSGAADFDRAIAAYRALKAGLTLFDGQNDVADTAAGLVGGKCSPIGYARLLTIVLNRINIPCITVRCIENTDGWNMMQLGGAWYAADAAADDVGDAGWMRAFGTVATVETTEDTTTFADVTYPLPAQATVAVGPVTLSNQDGIIGRFISSAAAFAVMTDTDGRYVLMPDTDLAVFDNTLTDPFAWSYTLPTDNWPRVASLTIEGTVVPNDVLGSVSLSMAIFGNPIIVSPVTFHNVTPQSNGLMILLMVPVTFSGENATLSIDVGGDEKTAVTFDYTGRFTYAGHCQVGSVTISGGDPIIEGIVSARSLYLTPGTSVELRGSYTIIARKLTLSQDNTLILTDRLSGKGTLCVGAMTSDSAPLNLKARILDADNYPDISFEEMVAVPTQFMIEETSSMSSAIRPGSFGGVLYTLSGGVPEDWTVMVAGVDATAQTVRDGDGRYRFVTE